MFTTAWKVPRTWQPKLVTSVGQKVLGVNSRKLFFYLYKNWYFLDFRSSFILSTQLHNELSQVAKCPNLFRGSGSAKKGTKLWCTSITFGPAFTAFLTMYARCMHGSIPLLRPQETLMPGHKLVVLLYITSMKGKLKLHQNIEVHLAAYSCYRITHVVAVLLLLCFLYYFILLLIWPCNEYNWNYVSRDMCEENTLFYYLL